MVPLTPFCEGPELCFGKADQFASWAQETPLFPSSGGAGINSAGETWHSVGTSGPVYHNQLGDDYAGVVDAAINDARGREAYVSGGSLEGVASSGTSPGWEAYAGAAASIGKEMYYSKKYGTWMGKNFKMYKQTWVGNGFAGGKNKFGKTTSNSFKWAGRIVGVYSGY